MQIKSLFDRLDVLGEDVKQKYITNLTECNPEIVVRDLGYTDWMLYDMNEKRGFGGGFVYSKAPEGDDFWYNQQMKFNLLNDEPYDY